MFRLLTIISVLLLPSTVFAVWHNGWFLHSSCATLQTQIRPAYQFALNEAQAVIDLHDMGDPEFAELKKLLLPSQQDKIEDAIQRFKNFINVFSNEREEGPRGIFDGNVIIYCDGTRFKDKTEKINNQVVLRHYDGELAVDWPHNDPSYNQCFGFGLLGVPAVTLQYTKKSLSLPDVLQLCPWWLTLNFASKFPTSSKINPGWLIQLPESVKAELRGQSKTPMDLYYSTLDRYFLKHLLLTYSTSTSTGVHTVDGMAQDTGVDGWLQAVQAAAEGNTEPENLSWLGIGAIIIKTGQMPQADGSIVKITSTRKRSSISDEELAARSNRSMIVDDGW